MLSSSSCLFRGTAGRRKAFIPFSYAYKLFLNRWTSPETRSPRSGSCSGSNTRSWWPTICRTRRRPDGGWSTWSRRWRERTSSRCFHVSMTSPSRNLIYRCLTLNPSLNWKWAFQQPLLIIVGIVRPPRSYNRLNFVTFWSFLLSVIFLTWNEIVEPLLRPYSEKTLPKKALFSTARARGLFLNNKSWLSHSSWSGNRILYDC